jgi:hypothetical protein
MFLLLYFTYYLKNVNKKKHIKKLCVGDSAAASPSTKNEFFYATFFFYFYTQL